MFSVIVPAHNEAAVIRRTLETILAGHSAGELELVVVCNGCTDATADVAREFGPPVRVIETGTASKSLALNLGDAAAMGWPRLYVDADVVVDLAAVRSVAKALDDGWLAAAPRPVIVHPPNTSWLVRAYFDAWMALPYVQEGMITAGVYGLSRAGRARFATFPDLLNDDFYVRSHFAPNERIEVAEAISKVTVPSNLRDLIRVRTRARLGNLQLKQSVGKSLAVKTGPSRFAQAFRALLTRPRLYPAAIVYFAVTAFCAPQAKARLRHLANYQWGRDESSRLASADGARSCDG